MADGSDKITPFPSFTPEFVAKKPPAFTVVWAHEAEPAPAQWLVKNLIPARGFGYAFGASGAGKSFYTLDVGLSIAAGRQVHDQRTKRMAVIYVAAEGAEGIMKRVALWRRERGVRGFIPFGIIPQAPALGSLSRGDEESEHSYANLLAHLDALRDDLTERGFELGLIAFDTMAATMAGLDENSSGDAAAVNRDLQAMAKRFECFCLAVHHSGVSNEHRMRGSSAFNAGGDLTIRVEREDDGLRVVTYAKVRDEEDGQRFAFRLQRLEIAQDEDGDPVTTCVVAYEDPPADEADAKPRRMTDEQALVMRAVNLCIDAGHCAPVQGVPGVPPGTKGVLRSVVKDRAIGLGFADADEKPETVRRSLNRVLKQLIGRNALRGEGDYVWPL